MRAANLPLLFILSMALPAILMADPTKAVVTIYTEIGNRGSGQGTGALVGPAGLIATAFHVVDGASKIIVYDKENRQYDRVRIVALYPKLDVALLRIDLDSSDIYLRMSDELPGVGEEIRIIGSPRGLPNQTLIGRPSDRLVSSLKISSTSGLPVFADDILIMPLDVTVYNGMSGAPVLAKGEQLVGLLSGSYHEGRGIAWAIPIRIIRQLKVQLNQERLFTENFAWPPFDLMSVGWRSLRRTYAQVYTPEHIQKLELLESILPTIQGSWSSDKAESRLVSKSSRRRCELHNSPNHELKFSHIDHDKATIQGILVWKQTLRAYSIPSGSALDKYCYEEALGVSLTQEKFIHVTGRLDLTVDKDGKFVTTPYILECFSDRCEGENYGEQSEEKIRVISREILTLTDLTDPWNSSEIIFRRVGG